MDLVALSEQGVVVVSISGAHWVAGVEAAGSAVHRRFLMDHWLCKWQVTFAIGSWQCLPPVIREGHHDREHGEGVMGAHLALAPGS